MVEIKTLDGDGRAKLQELTVHAKQIIEQDKKKTFKSNSEERQKVFISQRIKEYTAATRDLLAPEFSRLRVSLEQELQDCRMKPRRTSARACWS